MSKTYRDWAEGDHLGQLLAMLSTFNEKQMILENKIYKDIFFRVVYVEIIKHYFSRPERKSENYTANQGLYR